MDIPVLLQAQRPLPAGGTRFRRVCCWPSRYWLSPCWLEAGFRAALFGRRSKAAIPVGATLGVLLISGGTEVHRRVRKRLDRAFFRSAYDAQQILRKTCRPDSGRHDPPGAGRIAANATSTTRCIPGARAYICGSRDRRLLHATRACRRPGYDICTPGSALELAGRAAARSR